MCQAQLWGREGSFEGGLWMLFWGRFRQNRCSRGARSGTAGQIPRVARAGPGAVSVVPSWRIPRFPRCFRGCQGGGFSQQEFQGQRAVPSRRVPGAPSSPPARSLRRERLQAAAVKRILSTPSRRRLLIPYIYSNPLQRSGFSPSPRAPPFPELSPGFRVAEAGGDGVDGRGGHPAITGFAQLWEK